MALDILLEVLKRPEIQPTLEIFEILRRIFAWDTSKFGRKAGMSYEVRGGGLAWMPPAWVVEPALAGHGAPNLSISEQVNTVFDDKRVGKLFLCSTTVLTRRSFSGKSHGVDEIAE